MRNHFKILVPLFLLLGVSTLISQHSAGRSDGTRNSLLFNDVLKIISDYYVEPIPPEDLVMEAVQGLVESLDIHSALLDQRHHRRLMEQTRGQFGGIGIEISIRDDSLTVLAPIPGTPAQRIGLQSGDRIVRIEDEPTKGMSLEVAVSKLKGEPGTLVNVWIHRLGEDQDIRYPIVRAIIKIESIQAKFMLGPEVGYVRLGVFSDKSGEELLDAINSLKAHGMKRLIFDLRDNPGGLLRRAVDVADIFLDPGQVIVSTRGRERSSNQVFEAKKPPFWSEGPVICLISRGSASASEIVSGALQDHDKAVIVGITSYGKGSVQTLIDLSDNYALKLTTAKYYTPSGRCIHSDDNGGDGHHTILAAEDTLQTFTTDAGRIVHGGGGITPDLILRPDTVVTSAERKISKQAGNFRNMMFRFAVEFKNENPAVGADSIDSVEYTENFKEKIVELDSGIIAKARKMLLDGGIELTEKEYEEIDSFLRQWIYYYIADACYDRNTANHVWADYDNQLQKAIELIEQTPLAGNFVETILAGRTLPDTLDLVGMTR